MRQFVHLLVLLALCGVGISLASQALADEQSCVEHSSDKREILVHYDLYLVDGTTVPDASGNGYSAELHRGAIVLGKNKNAIQLEGNGWLAMRDVPTGMTTNLRSFTVGAYCLPRTEEGVLLSMGDGANGFSLYLKAGVPHFAIRSSGVLNEVVAIDSVALNQWVHLAGSIDGDGRMRLFIDAWPEPVTAGRPIEGELREPLCIGADPGSPVAEDHSPPNWRGLIEDIRYYASALDRNGHRAIWSDWLDRPGCGCR